MAFYLTCPTHKVRYLKGGVCHLCIMEERTALELEANINMELNLQYKEKYDTVVSLLREANKWTPLELATRIDKTLKEMD